MPLLKKHIFILLYQKKFFLSSAHFALLKTYIYPLSLIDILSQRLMSYGDIFIEKFPFFYKKSCILRHLVEKDKKRNLFFVSFDIYYLTYLDKMLIDK